MKDYSQYFKTIIDEREPGRYGRGSHISVLECIMPIEDEPRKYRFCVVWDEDHDQRIINVAEHLYAMGLLNDVIFIGERKGSLTVVFEDGFITEYDIPQDYIDSVEAICSSVLEGLGGDYWHVEVFTTIEDSNGYLIQDDRQEVIDYLNCLKEQWGLGDYSYLFGPGSLNIFK